MTLSIVIPARGEFEKLKECIESIRLSLEQPHEIIVVDDNSSTPLKSLLSGDERVKVIRLEKHSGPSRARNIGARQAEGDIIFFLDSDVCVKSDTIRQMSSVFDDPSVIAAVGVYDEVCPFRNFFSDYKNLWMRYTYESLPGNASLFFSAVAAIKKSVFLNTEGFDEGYEFPSTEDTAFGNTLWEMGIRPRICPAVQVVHKRRYSFISIMATDFSRASALLKIKLRNGMGNVFSGYKTSVPVTFLASIAATVVLLAIFFLTKNFVTLALLAVTNAFFNYGFLAWVYKKRGGIFVLQSFIFIFIDHLCIFFGTLYGFFSYYFLGKKY